MAAHFLDQESGSRQALRTSSCSPSAGEMDWKLWKHKRRGMAASQVYHPTVYCRGQWHQCSLKLCFQLGRVRTGGRRASLLSLRLDPPPKTITRGKKKALLFPPRDEYQGMNGPPAPNPGGQMDNSVGQAKAPHGSSSLGCFRVEATH